MGRGQLLYVVLLWWLVAGNFERALVHFTAPRLVTEGVIGAVALLCTLIVLAWPPPDRACAGGVGGPRPAVADADDRGRPDRGGRAIVFDWAVVRAVYGDRFAGHASLHIRFGPNATIHQGEKR